MFLFKRYIVRSLYESSLQTLLHEIQQSVCTCDAIMAYFGIPSKLIILTQITMENSTYHVKIGTIMTDGFQVGTGFKKRRRPGAQSL